MTDAAQSHHRYTKCAVLIDDDALFIRCAYGTDCAATDVRGSILDRLIGTEDDTPVCTKEEADG